MYERIATDATARAGVINAIMRTMPEERRAHIASIQDEYTHIADIFVMRSRVFRVQAPYGSMLALLKLFMIGGYRNCSAGLGYASLAKDITVLLAAQDAHR